MRLSAGVLVSDFGLLSLQYGGGATMYVAMSWCERNAEN
jgi:hypothetical protein